MFVYKFASVYICHYNKRLPCIFMHRSNVVCLSYGTAALPEVHGMVVWLLLFYGQVHEISVLIAHEINRSLNTDKCSDGQVRIAHKTLRQHEAVSYIKKTNFGMSIMK